MYKRLRPMRLNYRNLRLHEYTVARTSRSNESPEIWIDPVSLAC